VVGLVLGQIRNQSGRGFHHCNLTDNGQPRALWIEEGNALAFLSKKDTFMTNQQPKNPKRGVPDIQKGNHPGQAHFLISSFVPVSCYRQWSFFHVISTCLYTPHCLPHWRGDGIMFRTCLPVF